MAVHSLRTQLPRFLLGKHQLIATVVFAAFISMALLLLSFPFSHNAWFSLDRGEAFIFTLVFFLISLAIVIVSKMLMHTAYKADNFTFLHYILWNTVEIVLITLL